MAIQKDLSTLMCIEEARDISSRFKDLDVGIIALNAGCLCHGPFFELKDFMIEKSMNMNVLQPIYLVKAFSDNLTSKRESGKRSALIFTGSTLGTNPYAGALPYSAGKAFIRFLAVGLNYEFEQRVDSLAFNCGLVTTKLGPKKTSFFNISPKHAA